MSRYNRHIILSEIGQKGQDKLSHSKVLVVGAGGLGCPVLQYLTAAGVGAIGIMDFDVVEESNLQRQVLFGTSSLGMNKALAAKKRLEDLNPEIIIKAYPEKLTAKNVVELFKNYDIVVDGTDNFATRYLINDASILTNKPVVYGAIYKFEGQVAVFNYLNGPGYRCLFPTPPKEGSVANCSEVGVLGVLPGIIGTMQANEVIKIILGFEGVLSGKLFCYNAKTAQTTTLKFARSEIEFKNVLAGNNVVQYPQSEFNCDHELLEISAEEALKNKYNQFIDVRALDEIPQLDVPNYKRIPLGKLEQNLSYFQNNSSYIIVCQTGSRSKAAIQLLQNHSINNCYNLKGGVLAIIEQFKLNS